MRIVKLVVAVLVLVRAAPVSSRNRLARRPCAQYNSAAEATFRGHSSGSSGSDLPGIAFHPEAGGWRKTIEVHLATTKFVKMYDLTFKPGDELEVIDVTEPVMVQSEFRGLSQDGPPA